MNRIVSTCCNEAVVIRSNAAVSATELYQTDNFYECVKCGNVCDIKQQEVTE